MSREQRAGSVVAGRPVHVAARMGSGAAQIEAGDDVAMAGTPGNRPIPQYLLGDELGVEDLAALDPVDPLDVDWEEDLTREDRDRGNWGRVRSGYRSCGRRSSRARYRGRRSRARRGSDGTTATGCACPSGATVGSVADWMIIWLKGRLAGTPRRASCQADRSSRARARS